MDRKYYEAYDDRYRQVHQENLNWFDSAPSPIVAEVMEAFGIGKDKRCLEIGCGEGRDARYLLDRGYDLLATDISPEAVSWCRVMCPGHEERFQILDGISGKLEEQFDFIYTVAVVHMLVLDEDRDGFYRFIRQHLKPGGIALICTMGDGEMERSSDIRTAFQLQARCHEQTGRTVHIAGTSCRMVSFDTFMKELKRNGLRVLRRGITAIEPDFSQIMYAVVEGDVSDGHSSD